MTAKSRKAAESATLSILCDCRAFSKIIGNEQRRLVVGCDLVEERVPEAVGVRIPLAGALVGGKCRSPQRVGAVVAMHREVEPAAEKQLRPFPPGAELLDPAQEIVAIDQVGCHVRRHRSEYHAGLDDAVQLSNGAGDAPLRDVAKAGLEHEIELAIPKRHIDD